MIHDKYNWTSKVMVYRNNILVWSGENLIVTAGREFAAIRLAGTSQGIMSHMAVGSDGTAAALSNTTLGTELGRVALTSLTRDDNTLSHSATFPAGTGTGTITEAGIFNDASAGYMLARTTFPGIVKAAGDSISFVWNVTL